jgi:surfeit locus 1 family protein
VTAPHTLTPRTRARWQLAVLWVVGVALFAGFVALGVWQVQRRAWKLDLIERVSQRLQAPPVALPAAASWPTLQAPDFEYLHVQVQGTWLTDKTVLTQATTALGQGFWVLTPLQQTDHTVVLVNRGFVPASQREQWLAAPATPAPAADTVTVHGLLRKTEPDGGFLRHNDPAANKWYSRDVAAIAQARQLPTTAPFFMDAGLPDPTVGANPESTAAAPGPWPRQGLTIVRFSNSHLVYALTWFGLALMVVGAGVFVARYERRQRVPGHNTRHAQQP